MATAGSFGVLLRRHRRATGLPQSAVAERASMGRDGISALERGFSRVSRADTLQLLGDALQLSATERATFEAAAQCLLPGAVAREPLGTEPWTTGVVQHALTPTQLRE
jgi:transcriptional regulator with XRE-family HTH domain